MYDDSQNFDMNIIPAILPNSYYDIPTGVEKVYGAVDTVQIDFVDGHFASNRTWWFNNKNTDKLDTLLHEDEGLPHWDEINYEFDLMVKDPLAHIDTFVALGPSKIIFHVEGLDQESIVHYLETLPGIVRSTITFGMAIGVDTDPQLLTPFAQYIDTIQCMGIKNVGFQGQPFDDRVIDQIKKVKALFPGKHISVDGAVSLANAQILKDAGADILVVGSAVFLSSDIHGTIHTLARV